MINYELNCIKCGISLKMPYKYIYKMIIGIIGPSNSGRGDFARHLLDDLKDHGYDAIIYYLRTPVYEEIFNYEQRPFDFKCIEFIQSLEDETTIPKHFGHGDLNIIELCEFLYEQRKDTCSNEFWLRHFYNRYKFEISEENKKIIIIPDCNYIEDYFFIKRLNGLIVETETEHPPAYHKKAVLYNTKTKRNSNNIINKIMSKFRKKSTSSESSFIHHSRTTSVVSEQSVRSVNSEPFDLNSTSSDISSLTSFESVQSEQEIEGLFKYYGPRPKLHHIPKTLQKVPYREWALIGIAIPDFCIQSSDRLNTQCIIEYVKAS